MDLIAVRDTNTLEDGRVILTGPLLWSDAPAELCAFKKALLGRKVAARTQSGGSLALTIEDAHLSQTMAHTFQASIGVIVPNGVKLAEDSLISIG